MSEKKTYTGGCHCGRVRFDVRADFTHVTLCNCSICSRMGWLLAFVPGEDFTLRSGEDALTDYQFGKKHIHHTFCSTCGVNPFSRGSVPGTGKEAYVVNARCVDGLDLEQLTVKHFDGKSL
jgi:hypothetical protein